MLPAGLASTEWTTLALSCTRSMPSGSLLYYQVFAACEADGEGPR